MFIFLLIVFRLYPFSFLVFSYFSFVDFNCYASKYFSFEGMIRTSNVSARRESYVNVWVHWHTQKKSYSTLHIHMYTADQTCKILQIFDINVNHSNIKPYNFLTSFLYFFLLLLIICVYFGIRYVFYFPLLILPLLFFCSLHFYYNSNKIPVNFVYFSRFFALQRNFEFRSHPKALCFHRSTCIYV